MLTSDQKHQIKRYFAKQPVELVYLFGSQATGKVMPTSDYDFAVLFEENLPEKKRFDLKIEFMGGLGDILRTDKVEVLELNKAPLNFRYSVIAPRRDLYVKDENKRFNFECQTFSKYFDRHYYFKRHTLESLATIAQKGLLI